MHLADIQTLYAFNYWAKERIMSVVESLPDEHYKKDLGSSHGGIHGTLVHIMGAEELWLKRWKEEPAGGLRKTEEFSAVTAVRDHWNAVEQGMTDFSHTLKSDSDIMRMVTYRDLKGNEYSQPLYQMMQHLVNHSSYHRGQVVTMLRQLGVKPIGTDLIMFFREPR